MFSTSYTLEKYEKLIKSAKNRFGQQPVKGQVHRKKQGQTFILDRLSAVCGTVYKKSRKRVKL